MFRNKLLARGFLERYLFRQPETLDFSRQQLWIEEHSVLTKAAISIWHLAPMHPLESTRLQRQLSSGAKC